MTIAQAQLGPNPATRPLANHLLDLEFACERAVRVAMHNLPPSEADRQRALRLLARIRVGLVSGRRLPEEPGDLNAPLLRQLDVVDRVVARGAGPRKPASATLPPNTPKLPIPGLFAGTTLPK